VNLRPLRPLGAVHQRDQDTFALAFGANATVVFVERGEGAASQRSIGFTIVANAIEQREKFGRRRVVANGQVRVIECERRIVQAVEVNRPDTNV
jgi:hypothetical protein